MSLSKVSCGFLAVFVLLGTGCTRAKTTMSSQVVAPKPAMATTHASLPIQAAPSLAKSGLLKLPPTSWSAEQQARHVLDRLAFGPRPGDVEALAKSGVEPWIRKQLVPASIDDRAVDEKLAVLPTLSMSIDDLKEEYPKKGDHKPKEIAQELSSAKIVRAVESERQLQEVLVDFWFNHFNVDAQKGADKIMISAYEREAIRPHVLGKFRDLLGATASHPAMLFYLDNWLSVRDGVVSKGPKKKVRGLNENYGRELLELHTLGVDGGYSQDDVRAAARAFTGWTLDREKTSFVFRDAMHDEGAIALLGTSIDAKGKADGERVLDLVAKHPSTARFIAKKLCAKFVSDDPPKELVDRVAKTFTDTDGDLSRVYRAIFESPEFWADAAYRSKIKTPIELTVSAMRAVGAKTGPHVSLTTTLQALGQPLYRCPPPTGYPERSSAWVNGGALVTRINFGLDLGAGKLAGIRFDRDAVLGSPAPIESGALVDRLAQKLLHAPLSPATRKTLVAELDDDALDEREASPQGDEAKAARGIGLVLGSPEFQKQ